MSDQLREYLMNLDPMNMERQLISQCAPSLAGLKTSNIFITERGNVLALIQSIKDTGVSCRLLYVGKEKATFLIYRRDLLMNYLEEDIVCSQLKAWGYDGHNLGEALKTISHEYAAYMSAKRSFPHEMGLFLGYPLEDVLGFMKHEGKNYLCSGYWKVYGNLQESQRLFGMFDRAREDMLRLNQEHHSLNEILIRYEYKVMTA